MEYSNLLKDPRWQRERLKAMERDNFTCQLCFRRDRALNVHHKRYIPSLAPWEYPLDELITLCEDCHEKYHKGKTRTKAMATMLRNMAEALEMT